MSQTNNEFARREELNYKHLFEAGNMYSLYSTDALLNLTAGAPGPDLLAECCNIFEVATKERMAIEKVDQSILFQYGPAIGRGDFRVALAKFLSQEYRGEVNHNDIVVTTGATQGLHLILSTFIDFNGVIFVDEVTYMIALNIIAQFPTIKVVTVPLTPNGVDVAKLRALVAAHRRTSAGDKPFWGIYYTMTIHHNPRGICFSEDICREIIKISRENEILTVTDDVYNMLTYTDDEIAPKRLFAFDDMSDPDYRGNVISNGTFSKILAPGLRMGWMECPPRCVRQFSGSGILRSGGATNNYTSGILTTLLDMGLAQKQLVNNRAAYKERMLFACEFLRTNLPDTCKWTAPKGGYFIWITFPSNVIVTELNNYAREHHKVSAIAGNDFSVAKEFKNCIRLSIAFHTIDNLRIALSAFCQAYNEFSDNLK